MHCKICDGFLSMTDGKYDEETGKMGDTCQECKNISSESLFELEEMDVENES